MAVVLAWLSSNWQPVVIAILTIDSVLIPIFPNAGLLRRIKDFLTPMVPPQA